MRNPSIVLVLGLLTGACSNPPAETNMSDPQNPWSATFAPPLALDTERAHLEPLDPEHTAMDYAAFMSSLDHLHGTLHWGDWPPPGFTEDDNRKDLERHRKEFDAREAYAFTVQSADRTRCVGCIYVNPVRKSAAETAEVPTDPRAATLHFWVIESELASDLDRHLLESVLDWLERDWPFRTVYVPLRVENTRGIAIAKELGLVATTAIVRPDNVVLARAPH